MGIGFSGVILKAAQESFQTELTAIELGACSGVTITDNTLILVQRGKSQQSSPFLIQKANNITTPILSYCLNFYLVKLFLLDSVG